nr:hypothetical protein [Massilia sp. Dwa41.01b]
MTRAALSTLVGALLLAGCASVTPDGGFDTVADAARTRANLQPVLARNPADERQVADTVRALLARPLDQDAAVRIALLNHPGLQASYWKVGIAQAELAQAARLQNPSFGFKRLAGGGVVDIERSLSFGLLEALTLPLSTRMERRRFEEAKLAVGLEIEKHAYETRRAWVEAVAARQRRRLCAPGECRGRRQCRADGADGTLRQCQSTRRSARAGVLCRSQREPDPPAREAVAAREALTRQLGMWGQDTSFTLPERLPDLPAAPLDPRNPSAWHCHAGSTCRPRARQAPAWPPAWA